MLDMKREVKRGYTCSICVKGINEKRFIPDFKFEKPLSTPGKGVESGLIFKGMNN